LELNEINTIVCTNLKTWYGGRVSYCLYRQSLQQRPFFCNMRRILLFSVVNLSKYETYVLPYTSNPYRILG